MRYHTLRWHIAVRMSQSRYLLFTFSILPFFLLLTRQALFSEYSPFIVRSVVCFTPSASFLLYPYLSRLKYPHFAYRLQSSITVDIYLVRADTSSVAGTYKAEPQNAQLATPNFQLGAITGWVSKAIKTSRLERRCTKISTYSCDDAVCGLHSGIQYASNAHHLASRQVHVSHTYLA